MKMTSTTREEHLSDLERIEKAIVGLETGFLWVDTPQGYDYWADVVQSLREIKEDIEMKLDTL